MIKRCMIDTFCKNECIKKAILLIEKRGDSKIKITSDNLDFENRTNSMIKSSIHPFVLSISLERLKSFKNKQKKVLIRQFIHTKWLSFCKKKNMKIKFSS